MNILPRIALVFMLLLVPCGADAIQVTFLDGTETLVVQFDGQTKGVPDVFFGVGEFAVTRPFASFPSLVNTGTFGVALTERSSTAVSDFLAVTIGKADVPIFGDIGFRTTFFTFSSDPTQTIPSLQPLQNALLGLGLGIPEDGSVQNLTGSFRDALGNVAALPFDISVSVQSDLEPIPEPATLLLFGTTMVGLGIATRWRRRRQS